MPSSHSSGWRRGHPVTSSTPPANAVAPTKPLSVAASTLAARDPLVLEVVRIYSPVTRTLGRNRGQRSRWAVYSVQRATPRGANEQEIVFLAGLAIEVNRNGRLFEALGAQPPGL